MTDQPFQIEIRGLQKLSNKYAKLGKDLYPEMEKTTEKAADLFLENIPPYPEQGVNVTGYKRTGSLGRKWTRKVSRVGSQAIGKIGTNQSYAPWVVSEEVGNNGAGPQAWFHQDRWWTIQQVARDVAPKIYKLYRQWVRRMLRKG
jgi:hypothetical protein